MTSKERVIRTIEFQNPDRIPKDYWVLPAARKKYGDKLSRLLNRIIVDIIAVQGPTDMGFDERIYESGKFTDAWGCHWRNIQPGMIGEVAFPAISDWSDLNDYQLPYKTLEISDWSFVSKIINENRERFILGGWINIFERMQFIRRTENLYMDLFLNKKSLFKLRDRMVEFYQEYLKRWFNYNVDGIQFADDLGAQKGLLINKDTWKEISKPVYRKLMGLVLDKGKYVFFHSDGYILDLYSEFIDLGVKAINSQIWCMGIEEVAERYAGRITFWSEISRQNTLPFGSPEDIYSAKETMKRRLFVNGGGLIGQSEIGADVPIENIRELIKDW